MFGRNSFFNFSDPTARNRLPTLPTPLPVCGPPRPASASLRMYSYTPAPSLPPHSFGQVMPSHPLSESFFMNARRFGVSTICAMFSRVTSKTSGSSLASRNFSTSSANSMISGEKSKSMRSRLVLTVRQVSLRRGVPVHQLTPDLGESVPQPAGIDHVDLAAESGELG